MNFHYNPEAQACLDALESHDPRMFAAVDDELDVFEAESGLTRWKRRGYSGLTLRAYGFNVRGPGDDFLVLWQQIDPSNITVWYIGPPI